MGVPFIDLRRHDESFLSLWTERCRELAAAARFVGGAVVTSLEERLARELGVPHVVGCANGTDALQLALRAAGVGHGDTVVIPDATFWATFEAVVNVGAQVVTVDIDADDLQMDFALFRRAIDEHRPAAAVLVHLYGWASARLDELRGFCRHRGLPLIEDGAQSFASLWQGDPIHSGAELSTLSFYPAKVLGACGDAGAVCCSTPEIAETVRRLGDHGRTGHYLHGAVGWNSRMGAFEAAFLDLALDRLPRRLEARRRAAATYRERLTELGFAVAAPPDGCRENAYVNVTLLEPQRRPAVEARLREREIGFGRIYPAPVSAQPAAAPHLAASLGGEEADSLCRRVLNLPLFHGIEERELEEVLRAMEGVAAG